jgi:hypothetical protein
MIGRKRGVGCVVQICFGGFKALRRPGCHCWEVGKSLRGSSRAFHRYSESEIKRLRRSKICPEKTRILFGGRFCISGVTTDGRLPWINPTAANGFILSSIRKSEPPDCKASLRRKYTSFRRSASDNWLRFKSETSCTQHIILRRPISPVLTNVGLL